MRELRNKKLLSIAAPAMEAVANPSAISWLTIGADHDFEFIAFSTIAISFDVVVSRAAASCQATKMLGIR